MFGNLRMSLVIIKKVKILYKFFLWAPDIIHMHRYMTKVKSLRFYVMSLPPINIYLNFPIFISLRLLFCFSFLVGKSEPFI